MTPAWILRVAVCGEFAGFGALAIQGRQNWAGWIHVLYGVDIAVAGRLLVLVGLLNILLALAVLVRPVRAVVLAAVVWGFLVTAVQPFVGAPFWDFVGHTANWMTPLALLMMLGMPKKRSDWLE